MPRYHRMFFDGTLADGAEAWSTSVAFESTSGGAPAPDLLSDWADAVMDSFATPDAGETRLLGWLSNTSELTGVRIYSHPDVGEPADVAGASIVDPIGGSGIPDMPAQCALVISLLTGIPGKSFRGRMYWPRIAGGVTDGLRDSTVNGIVAGNVAVTLGNLSALSTGNAGEMSVVSTTRGLVTPVTSLQLGDVIDTQRRRRDALVENRFTASIP